MQAAVLGSPIGHSLSPVLHQAAYAHLQLPEWSYRAIECPPAALAALIARARAAPDFGGYSLTMPLKVVVLPLVDALEPLAEQTAAVNTVVKRSGRLYGANTDAPGLVDALSEAGISSIARPVVLGGGGSAQAAITALALLGASTIRVAVRNPEKATRLIPIAERAGVQLAIEALDPVLLGEADLVINTVPAAAWTAAQTLAPFAAAWPAGVVLFDLGYAPWPTPLAAAAAGAGARVLGGLDLLVHQAVGQIALMTGRRVDVAVLRAAGEKALAGPPDS